VTVASAIETAPASEPGFGIYVHWPFCKSKCPYCDFNSHVRAGIDEARWRAALLAELDHYAAETGGREVTSVFFGGGTPSLMEPETAAAVLDRIAARWRPAAGLEVTLEANPTSVESGRFRDFRLAGVNRVSLGIQALDDAALKFLGRAHDAREARLAIELARRHFARHSFDLIYARPGQTVASWMAELDAALDLAGEHLSVYQLTIEPGTAFHTLWQRGDLALPDDELGGALYEATQVRLAEAGLPAYEVSNHARPGAECRHNLTYWRYGDYLGIGPGAHGRVSRDGAKFATRQLRAPETWLAAVEAAGHGTQERLPVPPAERAEEILMMGLRLAEGVRRGRFRIETGVALEAAVDADALADLVAAGFLALDETALCATPAGRQRLNAVLARLVA
jgi:oxygen-independent coproporphyrinogen-3 oxidase